MSERMTAGDLTTDHYGLLIAWRSQARDGSRSAKRTAVCDELRRWVNADGRQVGITDFTPDGPFVGREHAMPASTEVEVGRRVRKARRRPWGAGALKPGEAWPDEADGAS